MRPIFSDQSWAEYLHWQGHDPRTLQRVNVLIEECRRHPFKGTGKPEPLKGDLAGWWSRRTTWGDVPACVADRERRLSTSARLPGLGQASGLGDLPRPLSAAVRSVRATSLPDMAERAAQPAGGRGLVV